MPYGGFSQYTAARGQGLITSGGGGASALSGLSSFSMIMGIAGVLQSSVGAYYSAMSERYKLGAEASRLEFEASTAGRNARLAEQDAHSILEAGRHERGRVTLQYGQVKESSRTRQAAAGVQAGVGSAAEVQASIEAAKEIDAGVIDRNAVRAAGVARMRAVDLRNQADMARTQAQGLRSLRRSIIPGLSAFTSLIGGAGQVSSSWLYQERMRYR